MAETIGSKLLALRMRAGLSLNDIATMAGYKGPSSVQAYFDPSYDVRPLRGSVAMRLGEALMGRGTPPIDIAEVLALASVDGMQSNQNAFHVTPTLKGQPKDVPVYTSVLAADLAFHDDNNHVQLVETTIFAMSEVVMYVRRPPGLNESRKVYAVIVSGGSMEPRYRPGDPVFVDPMRPPSIGDDVVIQMRADNESEDIELGLIKTLVRRSSTFIDLEQYRPEVRFRIPTDRVASIHRVIPWREAFGM